MFWDPFLPFFPTRNKIRHVWQPRCEGGLHPLGVEAIGKKNTDWSTTMCWSSMSSCIQRAATKRGRPFFPLNRFHGNCAILASGNKQTARLELLCWPLWCNDFNFYSDEKLHCEMQVQQFFLSGLNPFNFQHDVHQGAWAETDKQVSAMFREDSRKESVGSTFVFSKVQAARSTLLFPFHPPKSLWEVQMQPNVKCLGTNNLLAPFRPYWCWVPKLATVRCKGSDWVGQLLWFEWLSDILKR